LIVGSLSAVRRMSGGLRPVWLAVLAVYRFATSCERCSQSGSLRSLSIAARCLTGCALSSSLRSRSIAARCLAPVGRSLARCARGLSLRDVLRAMLAVWLTAFVVYRCAMSCERCSQSGSLRSRSIAARCLFRCAGRPAVL